MTLQEAKDQICKLHYGHEVEWNDLGTHVQKYLFDEVAELYVNSKLQEKGAVCPQCSGNGGGVTDDGWEVCKCQKNNQQQENLHTEWQCPNCGNFTKESNYLCCCSQACLKSWLDKTNIIKD